MKLSQLLLAGAFASILTFSANAQTTVTGGGGPLNAMGLGGSGGGGNSQNILPTSWSEFPTSSPVPAAGSIQSVTLTGLNHTWSGDLQIVLKDPNDVGYNLTVRLGVIAPAGCCGHSADFGGDYTWLAAGDPGINQIWPAANPGGGSVLPPGNYAQEFGTQWGAGWDDGADMVFNVDLASIPVVAGTWTLFVYDGAGGDTGDLAGWSMTVGGGLGTNYCMANANSTGMTGTMSATGSTAVASNNLTLTASNLPMNATTFFITSTMQGFVPNPSGSAGNLCLGGAIGRYVGAGQVQNSGTAGEASLTVDLTMHPQPTGLISVMPGETWNFQAWHRDLSAMGPTSNFTDGLEIGFV